MMRLCIQTNLSPLARLTGLIEISTRSIQSIHKCYLKGDHLKLNSLFAQYRRKCMYSNLSSNDWNLKEMFIQCNKDHWHEQPEGFCLKLRYIDTNKNTQFRAKGDAKTILALHGFAGTYEDMLPILKPFAEDGYRILLPVMPGLGITTAVNPSEEVFFTHTSQEKAELVNLFLQLLNVRNIDMVVGHCTGSCTMIMLLATIDNLFKSALFLCPIPAHKPPKVFQPHNYFVRLVRLYEGTHYLKPIALFLMQSLCIRKKIKVARKYIYPVILTATGVGYKYLPGMAMVLDGKNFPISYIYSANDTMVEENLSQEYAEFLGITSSMILDETEVKTQTYLNSVNTKHGISLNTSSHFPHKKDKHRELIVNEMKYILENVNSGD